MPIRPRTLTVFVVDDDESVRNSLGRLMRAEGFTVLLFESPERFLAEVTPMPSAPPNLLLTSGITPSRSARTSGASKGRSASANVR